MADTVAPFGKISDVDVVMSVITPQPVVGLGNLLILNETTLPAQPLSDTLSAQDIDNGLLLRKTDPTTGAIYREYGTIDAVAIDYAEGTDVYKKAAGYFAQDNHADRVAVLDFDKTKEYDSLSSFWGFNWTFACLSVNPTDSADITALSNIFESDKDHLFVVQVADLTLLQAIEGNNYTIGVKHDLSEPMDSAMVGAIAALTVGSVTWKFKELNGITPEVLTSTELAGINSMHAISYTEVSGRPQTTEGFTLSGEYIDTIHGIIWVKVNVAGDLQRLLQDNSKIPFEQKGINMVTATVTQTLEKAYEQGIILTGTDGKGSYTVTATPREQQSAADLSARKYSGVSFKYDASGAIHTLHVNGVVNSTTILKGGK